MLLHVANAPNIAPLGYVTAELLQSLGFKVDMQTMDFPTFAVRRLNQGSVSERGWNIAHTTLSAPEVEHPGGLNVDDQLELGRLHDRYTSARLAS